MWRWSVKEVDLRVYDPERSDEVFTLPHTHHADVRVIDRRAHHVGRDAKSFRRPVRARKSVNTGRLLRTYPPESCNMVFVSLQDGRTLFPAQRLQSQSSPALPDVSSEQSCFSMFWYSCRAMQVEPTRVAITLPWRLIAWRRGFASGALGCCVLGVWASGRQPACGQARSPQTLAADADAAYVRGDVQEAIRLYRELIKVQPGSVEARTNLGVALARAGQYKDAVGQYDEALKRAPENPTILLNLALAWYKQAAFDTATVTLERLRATHPENRQSLYLLADCYLRLGRNPDAVALLQPVYDADPTDRAVDFALGTALIRGGQIKQGEVVIEQVAKTGNQSEVDLLTGAALLAAHDSKAAANTIHKALESDPDLPGAWLLYARALLDSGDHDNARAAFLKALQADPNDFEANLYLGGMLRYDANIADATPYLEKAQTLRPASVEARFQVSLLNLARGRLQDALSGLQKVEDESPDFKEVHVQLAALYARLHRIEDSQRERAMVIQLDEKAREQAPNQSQP